MSKQRGDFPDGVPEDLRRPAMPLGHFAMIMAAGLAIWAGSAWLVFG
jgi:hypothetical protein